MFTVDSCVQGMCEGTSVKPHVRSNAGLHHGNLLESKGHVSTYSA